MKKKLFNPSLLFFLITAILFAYVPPKYSLIGKWSILNLDGTRSGEYVTFNKDSTCTVALPDGQIGERGNYFLNDSVFSIKNSKNVCGKNYWGKYNLTFHGNDSLHLALIGQNCL